MGHSGRDTNEKVLLRILLFFDHCGWVFVFANLCVKEHKIGKMGIVLRPLKRTRSKTLV